MRSAAVTTTVVAAAAAAATVGLVARRGTRRSGGRRALRVAAMAQRGAVASQPPSDIEAVAEAADSTDAVSTAASERVEPGVASLLHASAVPWLPEPKYRQFVRNVPGDAGFDPLGLAGRNRKDFMKAMESELKHSRLAMLAGVGFAAPELLHHRLATSLHLPDLMAPGGCTPTLLNGQLLAEPVLAASLGAIFSMIAFTDVMAPKLKGLPGYYGFDPLGVGDIEFSDFARSLLRSDVEWVAEAEVKHGRAAMVAVTYMAVNEFITGMPTWPSL